MHRILVLCWCMLLLSAVMASAGDVAEDEEVAAAINNHISNMIKLLTKTIKKGQQQGEFRLDVNASGIAQILVTHLFGLATLGKAVTSKSASLQGIKNILTLIEQPGS